ncbi:MAG: DNA/RNA non-specific endonuclease [Muribaculaceae bacterium]|nr:DNA/RNA non-specific endonuclease [Muribaculaceae bacterium]
MSRNFSTSSHTPSAKRRRPRSTIFIIFSICIIILGMIFLSNRASDDPAKQAAAHRIPLPDACQLLQVITNPDLASLPLSYYAFDISFNPDTHMPNWVAWELTPTEVRTHRTSRRDNFRPDPDVNESALPADYRNSGYDRGHIAPAADMKWDTLAMQQASLLTNICPQSHELNQGAWNTLENLTRQRVLRDSSLIIVAGPVLTLPPIDTIGPSRIPVPARYFKVILAPHADPPFALGFIMDNSYIPGGLRSTLVSVDSVESLTGHDFFSALPDSIEDIIESTTSHHHWRL